MCMWIRHDSYSWEEILLPEEIESIILDIASISSRLNKQLGVRLLPIPNKVENEFLTEFDMDFISNTRILDIKTLHLKTI